VSRLQIPEFESQKRLMDTEELAPVHFLSHGTAALLQEDSRVRDYWKKIGQDALNHGVKGVIIMVC
jgi:aromatic ring-opening dioxygenase catalytic subunit (LigB family)